MSVIAQQIGTVADAICAQSGWYCSCGCDPEHDKIVIGDGESRRAWLIGGVVYKVGRASASEYEHEALTAWRLADAGWAPPTSVYHLVDGYGDPVTVLAMEYLPDDGSPLDEVTLAAIKVAAPQTCRENVTAIDGRTYLIDGGDIELWP